MRNIVGLELHAHKSGCLPASRAFENSSDPKLAGDTCATLPGKAVKRSTQQSTGIDTATTKVPF